MCWPSSTAACHRPVMGRARGRGGGRGDCGGASTPGREDAGNLVAHAYRQLRWGCLERVNGAHTLVRPYLCGNQKSPRRAAETCLPPNRRGARPCRAHAVRPYTDAAQRLWSAGLNLSAGRTSVRPRAIGWGAQFVRTARILLTVTYHVGAHNHAPGKDSPTIGCSCLLHGSPGPCHPMNQAPGARRLPGACHPECLSVRRPGVRSTHAGTPASHGRYSAFTNSVTGVSDTRSPSATARTLNTYEPGFSGVNVKYQ